jgi:hypothetical protein
MTGTRSIMEETRINAKFSYEYPNRWSCLVDLVLMKGKKYTFFSWRTSRCAYGYNNILYVGEVKRVTVNWTVVQ